MVKDRVGALMWERVLGHERALGQGPAGNGAVGMTGYTCQASVMLPRAGSRVQEGTAPRAEGREGPVVPSGREARAGAR